MPSISMKYKGDIVTSDRIKEFRNRIGASVQEMSNALCISPSSYYGWESGEHHPTGLARTFLTLMIATEFEIDMVSPIQLLDLRRAEVLRDVLTESIENAQSRRAKNARFKRAKVVNIQEGV